MGALTAATVAPGPGRPLYADSVPVAESDSRIQGQLTSASRFGMTLTT
jgi:hypothetical protein